MLSALGPIPFGQRPNRQDAYPVEMRDVPRFFQRAGYSFQPDGKNGRRGILTHDGRSMRTEITLAWINSRSAAGPQAFLVQLHLSVDLEVGDGDAEAATKDRGPIRLPSPGTAFVPHPGARVTAFVDVIAPFGRAAPLRFLSDQGTELPARGDLVRAAERFEFAVDAFVRRHRGRLANGGDVDWRGARFPEDASLDLTDPTSLGRLAEAWGDRVEWQDETALDRALFVVVAGERIRIRPAANMIDFNFFPAKGSPRRDPRVEAERAMRAGLDAVVQKPPELDWSTWERELRKRLRSEDPRLKMIFTSVALPLERTEANTTGRFHDQVLRFADMLKRIRNVVQLGDRYRLVSPYAGSRSAS